MKRPSFALLLAALFVPAFAAELPVRLPRWVVVERPTPTPAESLYVVGGFDDTEPWSALVERAANLHLNASGARGFGDVLAFRGLGNTPFFGDPAVTVYLDDLPLGSGFSLPAELPGFAEATLHRGPTAAAQFGRAGPAGVLQLHSRRAHEAPRLETRLSVGGHGFRSAAVSARAGDRADARLALLHAERDGFIRNIQLGQEVDARRATFGHARLDLAATANLELGLQLLAGAVRDGAHPLVPLGGPQFEVRRGREGETHIDQLAGALHARARVGAHRFVAVTSATDWEMSPYINRLVLPPPLDSAMRLRQRGWNQEFSLCGEQPDCTWQFGAFGTLRRTEGAARRSIAGLFPIEDSNYRLRDRSAAVFGRLAHRVGDWALTSALRLEGARREILRVEAVPQAAAWSRTRRSGAWLPQLTVAREFAADTTGEIGFVTGFKPGGFSAFTASRALSAFGPERLAGAEAALRFPLHGRKWSAAARGFWYEIDGYQIERSFTAADYLVVNADRARCRGGEIELHWKGGSPWRASLEAGLVDARLRIFADPFTGASLADSRTPFVPEWDGAMALSYEPARGWFAGARVALTGRTFYDEAETAAFAQGARVLVTVRSGYAGDRWQIEASVDNATDERYYSAIIPGVAHGTPGAPRLVRVTLTARL